MTNNPFSAVLDTPKKKYWYMVAEKANERIDKLFSESGVPLASVLGNEDGCISSYEDAKKVLAYVLCHGGTSEEKACTILSACDWLHACNELVKGEVAA